MKRRALSLAALSACSILLLIGGVKVAFGDMPSSRSASPTPPPTPISSLGSPSNSIALIELKSMSWSSDLGDVNGLLSGNSIEARSDSEFVKINMVFARPVSLSKIIVDSCSGEFSDGAEFFFSPSWRRAFSEGGKSSFDVNITNSVPVTSLAINFRHNQSVCVKAIRFFDLKGSALELAKTSAISGVVSGVVRSGLKEVPIAAMPPPNRVLAKSMKIDPPSNSLSSSLLSHEKAHVAARAAEMPSEVRQAFTESGLLGALDRELTTREESDNWIFRFRSDRTFFIRGFIDEMKSASEFSALGTYEIVRLKENKIRVKLKGTRYTTAGPWDGVSCPPTCEGVELAGGKPIDDEIVIEKKSGGAFMVRNRMERKLRTLGFSDWQVRPSRLDE